MTAARRALASRCGSGRAAPLRRTRLGRGRGVGAGSGVVLLHVLAGTDPTLAGGEERRDGQGRSARRSGVRSGRHRGPCSLRRACAIARQARSRRHPRLGPASPRGAARPPETTLAGDPSRVDHAFVADLCRRFVAHLARRAGRRTTTSRSTSTGGRRLRARARARDPRGAVGRGRHLRRARGARGPTGRRARGRHASAPAGGVALVLPCHRVVAADGIGGYGTNGVSLEAPPARARGRRRL